MIEFLAAPFVACMLLVAIHCYLGLHVLIRDVIFVDLSLAQLAALGVAVGTLVGAVPHSVPSYGWALAFTVFGALVFSLGRFQHRRVSQEAVIGIVYAVSTATMFLILSHSAVEREEVEHMMVGRLLFVDWTEIAITAGLYALIAVVHFAFRKPFFAITQGAEGMSMSAIRKWDFLFYASFGVVVASSVQIAGVLLVFSLLIVPAACASLFWSDLRGRLIGGWVLGVVASTIGIAVSAVMDFPTGASIIAVLGATFGLCVLTSSLCRGR